MVRGSYLSDEELAFFGVKRFKQGKGRYHYIVPCDVCGKPFETTKYNTSGVYKCESCINESAKVKNRISRMSKELRGRIVANDIGVDYDHYNRFENALKRFGESYSDDIRKARNAIEKFDSVPEVIACIELLHIGARVIVQQKVGSFTVDFCLPDEKAVIEIDGSLYHKDLNDEARRDYAVQNMLGDGWVIRHVPADTVMKNHALFGKLMKRFLDERRFELKSSRRC